MNEETDPYCQRRNCSPLKKGKGKAWILDIALLTGG